MMVQHLSQVRTIQKARKAAGFSVSMKLVVDQYLVCQLPFRLLAKCADSLSFAGPQVYGCVACPMAASDSLKSLGFAGKQTFLMLHYKQVSEHSNAYP